MSERRTAHIAVMIDADNASPRIADGLFEEITKIGEASVRWIYGDFSGTGHKAWADLFPRYAIVPKQNYAHTKGKNATDIALVIDAMDLLHSARFDAFCLVSSDSDFTRLATRIREQGIDVYGVGEQKTPESFRQACHRFIYAENLLPEAPAADRDPSPRAKPLQSPTAAVPVIRKAVALLDSEDGWVGLGGVGQQLGKLAPDFDSRTYGQARLSDLVEKTGAFELDRTTDKGIRIRWRKTLKNKKTKSK